MAQDGARGRRDVVLKMAFMELQDIRGIFGQFSDLLAKRAPLVPAAPDAMSWDLDLAEESLRVNIPQTQVERIEMEDLGRLRDALYSRAD